MVLPGYYTFILLQHNTDTTAVLLLACFQTVMELSDYYSFVSLDSQPRTSGICVQLSGCIMYAV